MQPPPATTAGPPRPPAPAGIGSGLPNNPRQEEKHARLEAERALTTDEAARLIQKPEADARGVLNRLVEPGLVEARGERKGRVWHLSASTYRRLGAKAAYVRRRGFEPLQHEQMVLQYVAKHGRITCREAAELCRIASHQACDLLSRLVARGDLTVQGRRKGAFYVRASRNMDESIMLLDDSKKHPKPTKSRDGR
ncbi:MAG: DNA glycosylase AlkZ-like family protein [Bacteroidota bacterium]